ncbi:hypothetical protein D3C85_1668820 [compost metagenome]
MAVPVIPGLAGKAFTVKVNASDTGLKQPLEFVTTTVYLPATFASYVCAVAPAITVPSKYHW